MNTSAASASKEAKSARRLLLVYEDQDDEKVFTGHIAGQFDCTSVKYGRTMTAHGLDAASVKLVLLSMTEISACSEAMLRVMRALFADVPIIPPFVVLCSTSDSTKACVLAQDGIVDDFIVFKPLVDPSQVLFRMLRAVERAAMTSSDADLRYLALRGSHAADGIAALTTTLELGRQNLLSAHSEAVERSCNSIKSSVQSLGRILHATAGGDGKRAFQSEVWADEMAKFEDGQLQGILTKLTRDSEHAVSRFVEQCSQELRSNVEPLSELQSSCRDVRPLLAIVDDDEEVGDTVNGMLDAMDINSFVVRDPRGAVQSVASKKPDLILLDIDMPHLNGIEVLNQLKENPATTSIPVIMLTGRASQENVKASMGQGATDFIAKPFDYDTLHDRVRKALTRLPLRS